MTAELDTRRTNLATLRRCMADINALNLPGDFDLQQAVLATLAQLCRNAHRLHQDAERHHQHLTRPPA